ncbi:Cytochrome P450 [Corchorus olitorius]|uniref:Cytochrome P450 n=1 Tax=Corchorus olitorius TaxID=93759 RepID=A0A1R3J5F0_9ROSI|nr:Cytochrome P450 [Corchorus olitorius]
MISFQNLLPWSSLTDFFAIIPVALLVLLSHSIIVLVLLFSLLFLVKLKHITKKISYGQSNNAQLASYLPPGPTPWPIIGNLPEIWRNKPTFRWILDLMKLLDTDIACIRLGNTHVIPVTCPEIAREFLKKHDSVFASRPLTMATAYASSGFLSIAPTPWGDQWKKMRKVVASNIINPQTLRWLLNKRMEENDNLVRFIYNQCINSTKHGNIANSSGSVIDLRLVTRHYTGNVIRKMMFNTRYFGKGKEDGGPGKEEKEHVDSLFTVLGNVYLCTMAETIRFGRVKQWNQGERKEPEDLLDAFLLAKDSNGKPALSIEEIKSQCTDLIFATVDNPANAVEWTMAEMLNNPEILQKATMEIDSVVGNKERLVQETDLPKLNYITACAREAFRIHPIAPFNLPHVSNADATVAGYFIPKGSHLLLSRSGLGRNPKVWDEPLTFKPERHLKEGSSSKVDLTEQELRFISFSTGRRGCMGVALGTELTVMLLARLIQGFTWNVPPGESKIDISEAEDSLSLAKPLHAIATPRLSASVYSTLS